VPGLLDFSAAAAEKGKRERTLSAAEPGSDTAQTRFKQGPDAAQTMSGQSPDNTSLHAQPPNLFGPPLSAVLSKERLALGKLTV
jgi:hypothetical protein